METKVGSLGLNIPAQTLKSSQVVELTPEAVTAWRNRLPMADTGATANQVYHVLSDCNKVALPVNARFQILELLRTPVQFISQSLRKHYFNQNEPLSDKKLTIVKLAQTLQSEMANGYKLIVEQTAAKPSSDDFKNFGSKSIERILHYFNYILLRSYNLYSNAPSGLWRELYILFQLSERERLLEKEILEAFKHIFIVAASDPYKWRQSEQDALFNASTVWFKYITIKPGSKNDTPGIYLFELSKDVPPMAPTTSKIEDPKNCRILDLTELVSHLKSLLAIVEPDELHARMDHSNDPEYAIALPVLQGLIQEWNKLPIRENERIERTGDVRVCIGLSAIHYFLNGEKPFQPQQDSAAGSSLSALPTLSIQEEPMSMTKPPESIDISAPLHFEQAKKPGAFSTYPATEINESEDGYCLIWKSHNYPPIQAGELLGIEIPTQTDLAPTGQTAWNVSMVRWLKHGSNNELRLGVRRLSKTATAGAAQIVKEGKPAGYSLRCLVLETGILTPTLPFKPGSQVIISHNDAPLEEVELSKLRSATGSYKLFDYKSKEKPEAVAPNTNGPGTPGAGDPSAPTPAKKPEGNGDFDSIWSNL